MADEGVFGGFGKHRRNWCGVSFGQVMMVFGSCCSVGSSAGRVDMILSRITILNMTDSCTEMDGSGCMGAWLPS
jgi:hypothetical protein